MKQGVQSCTRQSSRRRVPIETSRQTLEAKVVTLETRFGLHGLKHHGVTHTAGTRRD
ncbi:MAG: hypothetical protein ACREPU_06175 [Rhodanobacteraceae bacterium]